MLKHISRSKPTLFTAFWLTLVLCLLFACAYETEEELFGLYNCSNEVSYYQEVQPILLSKCAVPQCHDGADRSIRNFTIYGIVHARAGQIKERTGNRTMPPSNAAFILTSEEIGKIACWVDAGADNN